MEAAYAVPHGSPASADVDDAFTMFPPTFSRCGRAAWHINMVPLRLTASTRFQSSKASSWKLSIRSRPAMLQSTSILLKRSIQAATAALMSSGRVTSQTRASASPPRSIACLAVLAALRPGDRGKRRLRPLPPRGAQWPGRCRMRRPSPAQPCLRIGALRSSSPRRVLIADELVLPTVYSIWIAARGVHIPDVETAGLQPMMRSGGRVRTNRTVSRRMRNASSGAIF